MVFTFVLELVHKLLRNVFNNAKQSEHKRTNRQTEILLLELCINPLIRKGKKCNVFFHFAFLKMNINRNYFLSFFLNMRLRI